MTDQTQANAEQDAPILHLQKVYTKDISFESPNAPDAFMKASNQLNIDMNLALNNRRLDDDNWEVVLKIHVHAQNKEKDTTVFEVEVEQAGVFLLRNIPEEHLTPVLAVECPTILFPYIRQVISQLTMDGGFLPFIMEPVNFRAVFENSQRQAAANADDNPTVQ